MDPRGRLRVSRGAKERQRDCTGRRPAATQIVKVGIRVLRRATRTHSMPPAMTRTKSKNEVRFLSQPTPNPAVEPLESFVQTLYGCLNSGGQNPYRLENLAPHYRDGLFRLPFMAPPSVLQHSVPCEVAGKGLHSAYSLASVGFCSLCPVATCGASVTGLPFTPAHGALQGNRGYRDG
jgi:hypothetical protein